MTESARSEQLMRAAYEEILRLRGELQRREAGDEPIAVIGIGCRLGGGISGPDELWRALAEGRDAVTEVPASRFDIDRHFSADPDEPGKTYSRWGSFLDDIDGFEPEFFGISPREAAALDPQQRLLLELAWEAFEDAAIPPARFRGSSTGLFVGLSMDDYSQWSVNSGELSRIDAYSSLGCTRSIAVGRVAYCLDLHGPALQLDTTCSSSLLATHLAVQSLRSGEAQMALAGGVNLILSPAPMVGFSKLRALSPTGRCKTFDASADGYVRGEGCALVLLKRLRDALADGDPIRAVIRASAVNHDGRSNGLTAPNGSAQEAVIRSAMQRAKLAPADVQFVEAHGTGTPLGDPIEINALARVLCEGRDRRSPLYVGALKSNFGHLEAAAGVMGLVKAALSVERRLIPPNLHFLNPNPRIAWSELPIEIPTRCLPWPDTAPVARAGVNSYGMSGTNAHVVVEQPPAKERPQPRRERKGLVLFLSSREPESLGGLASRHARAIRGLDEHELADYCYSVNVGRARFDHRAAFSGANGEELEAALSTFATRKSERPAVPKAEPKLGYLFTGQGAQWPGMGRELFETSPFFEKTLRRVCDLFDEEIDQPLLPLMFGDRGAASLTDTRYAQCALFAFEVALFELLRSWNIRPSAALGHSLGEYVAAFAAGVLELEDAVKLVATRGRLMSQAPGEGGMLAVFAPEATLQAALNLERVEIAAVNAPGQCVLSGARSEIEAAARKLERAGIGSALLNVSKAFHSAQMTQVLAEFEEQASRRSFGPAKLPLILNATGQVAAEGMNWPAYLARQLRQRVLFEQCLRRASELGCDALVELGPQPVLTGFALQTLPSLAGRCWPSGSAKEGEWRVLSKLVARVAELGVDVDFEAFDRDYGRTRRSAASYAFARRRHWLSHEPPWVATAAARSDDFRCIFETGVAEDTPPFLADHRIFGELVVPAAHWLSFIAAVKTRGVPASVCELEDVTFPSALVLEGGREERVGLYVKDALDESELFEVRSGSGVVHAKGRVRTRVEHEIESPPALPGAPETKSAEAVYGAQWQRGVELGQSFRWLTRLRRDGAVAAANLVVPPLAKWGEYEGLHPGALDSAFQLLSCTVDQDVDECVIPAAVRRATICALRRHGDLECHARAATGGSAKLLEGHLELAESGRCVARIEGLEVRRVTRAALGASAPVCFRRVWREAKSERAVSPDWTGVWVVLDDGGPLARDVSLGLASRGVRCVRARAGADWAELAPEQFVIDPTRKEHYQRLLERARGDGELRGILQFWTLRDEPGELTRLGGDSWLPLLHTAQTLSAVQPTTCQVWTFTQRSLRVGSEELGSAAAGLIQGLSASLNAEYPELCFRHLDLEESGPGAFAALMAALEVPSEETTVACRDGKLLVERLIQNPEVTLPTAPFQANRSYLITGGTGALGLLLARWLVQGGARSLVIVARKPPSPAAAEAFERLRREGARVEVVSCDVSDRAQVGVLFETLRARDVPELAGVFHASAVTEDTPVDRLTKEVFARVLDAKALAAWHLHQATLEMPLEHFVLFSSVAGLFGSPGQANYAAANAYLDVLADLRRSRGLPALSVAFGPWAGAGIAGRLTEAQRRRLADSGLGLLEPARALSTLESVISSPANVAVAELIPSRLAARGVSRALLEELLEAEPSEGPRAGAADDWLQIARALDPAQRRQRVSAELREQVGAALGIAGSRLDADQPLRDLGMDSLMMTELGTRIRRGLGVRMAPLAPDTTLTVLVEWLLEAMATGNENGEFRSLLKLHDGEGMPFFCVHPVGGDVACYRMLAEHLRRPFFALQARGLDGECPPVSDLRAMAESYVAELRLVQRSGPYRLGGWSLGGVIAFEMARLLAFAGESVERLVLIDSYAPLGLPAEALGKLDVLRAVAHDLGQILQLDFDFPEQEVARVPEHERLSFLLDRVPALEASTPAAHAVFCANLRALYGYRPEPYPGDVHVLRASRPAEVLTKDSGSSWRDLIGGACSMQELPGDHYLITRDPEALAACLGAVLDNRASPVRSIA